MDGNVNMSDKGFCYQSFDLYLMFFSYNLRDSIGDHLTWQEVVETPYRSAAETLFLFSFCSKRFLFSCLLVLHRGRGLPLLLARLQSHRHWPKWWRRLWTQTHHHLLGGRILVPTLALVPSDPLLETTHVSLDFRVGFVFSFALHKTKSPSRVLIT